MSAHMIHAPFTFTNSDGVPVMGGYVESYEPNGSSTPKALYFDKNLGSSAGSTNTLNDLGQFVSGPLFGDGDYYFMVFYAGGASAGTYEYVEGAGSGNNDAAEWVNSVTPTYLSATTFSVPGDLTGDYHERRRVQTENTGGTIHSTIVSSVFSSVTTVTVLNDSGTLDSGLSSVKLGFLRADNRSGPYLKHRGCYTQRTANQSILSAGNDAIIFDTGNAVKVFDTDGIHSLSTTPTRHTVPAGAKYVQITISVEVNGGSSTGQYDMFLWKNGSPVIDGIALAHGVEKTVAGTRIPFIDRTFPDLPVSGGDYFEIYVSNGGSTTTTFVAQVSFKILE